MIQFNKKTIVIIVIITLLLITIGILALVENNKQPIDNQSSTNSGSNVPNTTGNGSPTNTPNSTNTTQGKANLPANGNYSQVANPSNNNDVQASFNNFVSKAQTPNATPRAWTQFTDQNNNILSINQVAQNLGLSINSDLQPILDQHDYDFTACNDKGKANYGFQLTVKYVPTYPEDVMLAAQRFMKNWESTLFQDTYKVLFPNYSFTPQQLQQKMTFKDGTYRYAQIMLPDGTVGSINYAFVGNYIVVTSSKECLDKTSTDLIPSE